MAVARQEALQAEHGGVAGWSDQHRSAAVRINQSDPAQDQRAHDALAQFGLGHHQRAQRFGIDDERIDVAHRVAVHQRRPARQLRHFGRELARPDFGDRRAVAHAVVTADGDAPRQHHQHAEGSAARLEQHLAVAPLAPRAETVQTLDFGRAQHRENLVTARLDIDQRRRNRFVLVGLGNELRNIARQHGKSVSLVSQQRSGKSIAPCRSGRN